MIGTYPVTFGSRQVGKVQILGEGLYYRVICNCRITGAVVCRLSLISEDSGRVNLGIIVPGGDGFYLDRKIPRKKLCLRDPEFQLLPAHDSMKFVPICPEEPFSYIEKLKDGYLAMREGRAGVMIHI